jgi:hypothetical protein
MFLNARLNSPHGDVGGGGPGRCYGDSPLSATCTADGYTRRDHRLQVFWDVTQCRLVKSCRRLDRSAFNVPKSHRHNVTTQKTPKFGANTLRTTSMQRFQNSVYLSAVYLTTLSAILIKNDGRMMEWNECSSKQNVFAFYILDVTLSFILSQKIKI